MPDVWSETSCSISQPLLGMDLCWRPANIRKEMKRPRLIKHVVAFKTPRCFAFVVLLFHTLFISSYAIHLIHSKYLPQLNKFQFLCIVILWLLAKKLSNATCKKKKCKDQVQDQLRRRLCETCGKELPEASIKSATTKYVYTEIEFLIPSAAKTAQLKSPDGVTHIISMTSLASEETSPCF